MTIFEGAEGNKLFERFLALSAEAQEQFLSQLALHLDLGLPDSTHVLLPREEFARLAQMVKRDA